MLGKIKGRRRRGWQDEMVGWHHWLNGHEFQHALGVGEGQGSLASCSPWGSQKVGHDWATELNSCLYIILFKVEISFLKIVQGSWLMMTETIHCLHTYYSPFSSLLLAQSLYVQLPGQRWSYWEIWSLFQFWTMNHKWSELITVMPSLFLPPLTCSNLSSGIMWPSSDQGDVRKVWWIEASGKFSFN